MPKKLKRSIRLTAKYDDQNNVISETTLVSANDKKWENKLNEAGLSRKDMQRLEKTGAIELPVADEDEDGDDVDATSAPVHELADSISTIDDVAELRKLRRRDKRVSAKAIYDKRIKEIQEAEKTEKHAGKTRDDDEVEG
jgi:hypothetical protein